MSPLLAELLLFSSPFSRPNYYFSNHFLSPQGPPYNSSPIDNINKGRLPPDPGRKALRSLVSRLATVVASDDISSAVRLTGRPIKGSAVIGIFHGYHPLCNGLEIMDTPIMDFAKDKELNIDVRTDTDFTSREAKVWEAKSKATERNWKKRKEEELICKICGESGHFTQVLDTP
nr:nucleic acid binding protein [Ipomoea batatas]